MFVIIHGFLSTTWVIALIIGKYRCWSQCDATRSNPFLEVSSYYIRKYPLSLFGSISLLFLTISFFLYWKYIYFLDIELIYRVLGLIILRADW